MSESPNIPIQKVEDQQVANKCVELHVMRLDQIHPVISGNKWYKLKHNLEHALEQGYGRVLSFGGAYSNHIHALAGAAKDFGLESIGLIRGEETNPLNPTLSFARDCGMELVYIDRDWYREKETLEFAKRYLDPYQDAYIIPEGGSNTLAVEGCKEVLSSVKDFDYAVCCVGTGGTYAGLISSGFEGRVIGIPVLKGGFLKNEIISLLQKENTEVMDKIELIEKYQFGGYAKFSPELIEFINNFKLRHAIPLDPIYTGKMMYAVLDLIERDYFPKSSRILAIHSGGLQGIEGFNLRHGHLIQ